MTHKIVACVEESISDKNKNINVFATVYQKVISTKQRCEILNES